MRWVVIFVLVTIVDPVVSASEQGTHRNFLVMGSPSSCDSVRLNFREPPRDLLIASH